MMKLHSTHRLLEPVQIGNLHLKNRLSVAPMTRVSSTADGTPTARMAEYYRAFAAGGFGLIITEGTYPDDRFSQGYLHQPGIVSRSHVDRWRKVTDAVHEAEGIIVLSFPTYQPASQEKTFVTPFHPHPVASHYTVNSLRDNRRLYEAAVVALLGMWDQIAVLIFRLSWESPFVDNWR